MKTTLKRVFALLAASLLTLSLSACSVQKTEQAATDAPTEATASQAPAATAAPVLESVDYASQIALNMHSETVKQEVTVKTYIDGDTVHFFVPETVMPSGVLKARFLAINTPESTGKIEEYGKTAAAFTREKLSEATSIVVESDDDQWNADSTGDRYLVWVWYKTADMEDYRNLNIEILQNGLAIANSSAQNRYGSTCMAAIEQAKAQKLHVHSKEKDPDFFYGDAVELTLKELRCNVSSYDSMKVAFNGVISTSANNSAYVEAYDAETDMYFGMPIYLGYGLNGAALEILKVGNEVRIVGTVQYYEAGGTYQVSGLTYYIMDPDHPSNIRLISEGHASAYMPVTPDRFVNGQVSIETENGTVDRSFAELAQGTTVTMQNLIVKDAYTTTDEGSSSAGALTLYCEADGLEIVVRTGVLHDENQRIITQDAYLGKTIDVKGVVDLFEGNYQIRVFSAKNIDIHD